MPRKTHPAAAVMTYFRTQPKEVCDLTLAIIKDEMKMRFTGLQVAAKAQHTRKLTKATKKTSLPPAREDTGDTHED